MTTHNVPMYPALALMEKKLPPLRYGRPPYWRPPVAPISDRIRIPMWNWTSPHELPEGAEALTLDVNGAYLGAIGGAVIAHGNLTNMGEWDYLPTPRQVPPGYYKITVPNWSFSGTIVNPLGQSADGETSVWIAHPTLVLLLELLEDGSIGDFGIIDSWTCAATTGFRAWTARLKVVRNQCLDAVDHAHPGGAPEDCECGACDRYGAFKEGYSAALSMMLTGEKCHTHRPDWAHAIYAQHAASSWRKAWRYTATGRTLLGMGRVDEITVVRHDLPGVLGMAKPPFRVDGSGRILGAFKHKATPTPPPAPRTTPAVTAPPADEYDII